MFTLIYTHVQSDEKHNRFDTSRGQSVNILDIMSCPVNKSRSASRSVTYRLSVQRVCIILE